MRHKHYDMIVAKAANVDLVVFFNLSFGSGAGKWEEAKTTLFPAFRPDTEYFLCLPRHKEAVLTLLNGGDIQITTEPHWDEPIELTSKEWCGKWNSCHMNWYMSPHCQSRTKPRKEKRWIAIKKGNKEVGRYTCETIEEAKDMYIPRWWSHHEVEIEVEV